MSEVISRGAAEQSEVTRSSETMLWNHTGSWRFLRPRYLDKIAPCSEACPAGEDIAKIELLVSQGALEEAWLRIREENPFPGVCGRVCPHPCKAACNRKGFDGPVSINALERYLADRAWKVDAAPPPVMALPTGKRVAVVGAGPAGLTAACFLRRMGHEVDLFDAREEPGGMLRYAIPEYRLPPEVLSWEIHLVLKEGVRFHPRRLLGQNLGWGELAGYDAVFLAIGAWTPVPLGVEGQELAHDGLEMLDAVRRGVRPRLDGPMAVIGGGNTAVDVARTLLRLGAKPTIYYRRRLEDMPALPDEIEEASEEGIPVRTLLSLKRIKRTGGGRLRLTLTPMHAMEVAEDGRARVAPADRPDIEVEVAVVFTAIGANPSSGLPKGAADSFGVQAVGSHVQRLTSNGPWAGRPPVFLGGDLVNDRKTVVDAIASGKEAAVAIDAGFRGLDSGKIWPSILVGGKGALSVNCLAGGDRSRRQGHVVRYEELNTSYFFFQERENPLRISPEDRSVGFHEVRMSISGTMAVREAMRCFRCGICDQCDNCYHFCPDVSVLRDTRAGSREVNYDYCKGCGVCVAECPRNAMVLEEIPR